MSTFTQALDRLAGTGDPVPCDYDRLVDPLTGPIRWIRENPRSPRLPRALRSFSARGAESRRLGEWPADPVGGSDGTDPDRCRRAAIGEFLERYCGNYIPSTLTRASYRELRRRGLRAVDPDELVLYSQRQYALPGFPFVPFTHDLTVNWTAATSLVSGETTYVPAALVWVNYFYRRYRGEAPTNFHMFSGIAAGGSVASAALSGLRELIERDATMMWWLADYPAVPIDPASDPQVNALVSGASRGVSWHLVALPSAFGVPVAGALLVDDIDGIAGMGFGCRDSLAEAMVKAMAEASQLHRLAWGIKDPHGLVWRAVRRGVLHPDTVKPFRADLRYLDSYRPDFRDVTDLVRHSQIYLDRRLWPQLARITDLGPLRAFAGWPGGPAGARTGGSAATTRDVLAAYVNAMAAAGFDVLCVDVTTRDVRQTGLRVVRVVVPGLLPNGPAGFPFLGGRRLYEVPVARGWHAGPVTEEGLNRVPLPHS